jgi:hypothetical protein
MAYLGCMCRSIKTLRGQESTDDDVRAAALQFVRKISGYRSPSRANEAAFNAAVEAISESAGRLLAELPGAGGDEAGGQVGPGSRRYVATTPPRTARENR